MPTLNLRTCITILLSILASAALIFVAVTFSIAPDLPWGNWYAIGMLLLLFAIASCFLGTIVVLDGKSDLAYQDMPLLRTLLCGFLSASAAALIQTSPKHLVDPTTIALAFLVGAAFGWLGWRWVI